MSRTLAVARPGSRRWRRITVAAARPGSSLTLKLPASQNYLCCTNFIFSFEKIFSTFAYIVAIMYIHNFGCRILAYDFQRVIVADL